MRWLPSKTESQPIDDELSTEEYYQLVWLCELYDAGVIGGEQDGEITVHEFKRLAFLRWQLERSKAW